MSKQTHFILFHPESDCYMYAASEDERDTLIGSGDGVEDVTDFPAHVAAAESKLGPFDPDKNSKADSTAAYIEKPQDWFFTFGSAHKHPQRYVKIHDTYQGARRQMFNATGGKWAMQYSAEEFAPQPERYGLTEIKLEEI